MDQYTFLQAQLSCSAAGFAWAVEQVPAEKHYLTPPRPGALGEWSLARHVFHMLYYERYLVLANIQRLAHLPITYERDEDQDMLWQEEQRDVKSMLKEFQRTRNELITLLSSFDDKVWDSPEEQAPWGEIFTLRWHVVKAYQHTCEHTHAVLSFSLFWGSSVYKDLQDSEALSAQG